MLYLHDNTARDLPVQNLQALGQAPGRNAFWRVSNMAVVRTAEG